MPNFLIKFLKISRKVEGEKMSINKLNIVNGIIQDNSIDGIPVKRNIVDPKGLKMLEL